MPMKLGHVSTGMVHFFVRVDNKLWIGSSQQIVLELWFFSFAHTAKCLVTNVLTALIGTPCMLTLQMIPSCWVSGEEFCREFGCKVFSSSVRFLTKCDKPFDSTNVVLHSSFEHLLDIPHACVSCDVAFGITN